MIYAASSVDAVEYPEILRTVLDNYDDSYGMTHENTYNDAKG